jgi:cbb3-type cytochrome oxidase subunit 3
MLGFDVNYLRGAALVLLIIAFLAMWKWAWSDKRKDEFRKMSQLPLEDDPVDSPADDTKQKGSKE